MKTGFVILNFNSWELTSRLAKKVSEFQNINMVVITDNCSTDDSFINLKKLENPIIHVVTSGKNGGYSYGNNFGAQYCTNHNIDILFIANPDIDIEEEDFNRILNGFRFSKYSLLSGIEYGTSGTISNPSLWKLFSFKDDLINCFYLGRKFSTKRRGIPLDSNIEIQKAEMVRGSLFAVRLKDFWSVGGFDEAVFLFCEERILAKKFLDAGKYIGIVTAAKYHHNHSASINRAYHSKTSQIRLLYKSRLYYNQKYNQIGLYKSILLQSAMEFSIIEFRIVDFMKFIKYKVSRITHG